MAQSNIPSPSKTKVTTLHWWMILTTLSGAFLLFACNSASTSLSNAPGAEYIGVWENAHVPGLSMTITQKGDLFVVHTMELGGRDRLATVRNGMLQFSDGSGTFLEYHKQTDTITSSGNSQFLYRRKKQ
jgi:hypothetical protein